jgi:hypothetical protein
MDDVPLNPFPFSMDNSDLFEPFLLAFQEILLQKRRDLLRRESVKVNPILNGNSNSHKVRLKAENSKLKFF